jgi:hypothetical protein
LIISATVTTKNEVSLPSLAATSSTTLTSDNCAWGDDDEMDFSEIPVFGELISDKEVIDKFATLRSAPPPLGMSFAQTAWKNEDPRISPSSYSAPSPTSPVKEFRPQQILKRIPPPPVVKEQQAAPLPRKEQKETRPHVVYLLSLYF